MRDFRVCSTSMHFTLRTKGVLAVTVLILYIALVGLFIAHERQKLVLIVQQMESIESKQAFLTPLFNGLSHSLVDIQTILNGRGYANGHYPSYAQLASSLEPIGEGLTPARQLYPLLAQSVGNFERAVESVRALNSARHLAEVRNSEQELIAKLNEILTALRARSADLAQSYHDTQQLISVFAVAANVTGAVTSVAVILLFFTTLTRDIKRLQDRAIAIVAGYSGEPLVNKRRDEVGGLIDAVNRMQVDLRHWEQQQEMSRQQRFHQEKMAAVGSLAAAIGHEVSNPIAAISGVAQVMIEETKDDNRKISKVFHDFAAQILRQTERIALIMRQMATLTMPHSPDPELIDLNALIESTCSFIAFDTRFAGIEFQLDLDRDIPAVTAVADHITQIMMNLLINAADAMEHLPEPGPGQSQIRIATRLADGEIQVLVTDNGHGMSPEVLKKAFDESFTTKPPEKGRGIGLFLCKKLIEKGRGRIELASTQGVGTTANIYLPLSAVERAAA